MLRLTPLLFLLWVFGCRSGSSSLIDELLPIFEARDYFTLRERLEELPSRDSPEALFFLAAVQNAFNEPVRSNTTIDSIPAEAELPESIRFTLGQIRLGNYVRLYRYAEAYEVARTLLDAPPDSVDPVEIEDLRNSTKLLEALRDVPPQRTMIRDDTLLTLEPAGHLPIEIAGFSRRFAFDTGANFSVLMRSEAQALGLPVKEVGIDVGTSTDVKVAADVAVADQVVIGNIAYRHVVFLVFPDEALSFPEHGVRIPGLIGFPLIKDMGEIRFRGGEVEIPSRAPNRPEKNMALVELRPLVRVSYERDAFICQLDTGAGKTMFYEPFFRRYRDRIESLGSRLNAPVGGVGGIRAIPAHRIPEMELSLGGKTVTLKDVDVFTDAITEDKNNILFCNIGRDVLEPFDEYSINFRSMSFILGSATDPKESSAGKGEDKN
jgi:hypothetical protein